MLRLVQLQSNRERRVAMVEEPRLRLLREFESTYALARAAIQAGTSISALARERTTGEELDYDAIYGGGSAEWRLLKPIDHPEPSRCLISGTGLTHLGSAKDRATMHNRSEAEQTDSMRMFRWGVEGGRPAAGAIGIAPEWFYKGDGSVLRGHGEPILRPAFAEDAGEEGEITGIYIVGPGGRPCRVGMCIGNECSDHRFEKRNYLNLAGSKLRQCAIGPELVVDPDFRSVPGKVAIERGGKVFWSKEICSGEAEMCHSLQNIEHHHFKFDAHRREFDLHVHYFGACSLSFGDGVQLANGDVMVVGFTGFGRPLRNVLSTENRPDTLISVSSLA